uniref:G-protein coupled receptors family 1 profile domain-containing protein n=1 Tax=Plectus sambesii TaxID=2011161 RepID=A0A914UYI7_9BILA
MAEEGSERFRIADSSRRVVLPLPYLNLCSVAVPLSSSSSSSSSRSAMYTTLSSAGTSHSTPLPPNAVVPSPLIYNDSESDDAAKRHSAVINALYEDTIDFEQKIGIIIPSIFAVVVLIGLVGNFLVIVIIALNRQMRNSTNTLIIGLAASDLLFLTLCVPFTAADYALPVWAFPYWWCGMMNYLQHVSAYASVWTLTLMALDRFLAVVFPIQSMTLRSMRNTTVSLVVLYTLIAVSQTPVGLSYGVFTYSFIKEQRSTCAILAIATKNATVHEARAYYMTFNMFGYVVP